MKVEITTSMTRRFFRLFLLLAAAACDSASTKPVAAPAPAPVTAAPATPVCRQGRTFIVVRHAEKASATEKDPSLSERGRVRSEVLASMLARAKVTRLVATPYKRTQETLAPLAGKLGLPVEVRPADKTADLLSELRGAPDGAVIVVASHSNVVPMIVRELGQAELSGVAGDMLPEDEFGRVVLIDTPCGATRPSVLELSSDR